MALEKYKAKRDFKKTSEPKGKIKRSDAPLTFVVQKHAASHLHYDFRLEAEGVLKSWAVPKGIPRPGEKRLAMMVEDHPLDYGNFEGIIPEGNYGAGTVMLWDRGTYEPKEEGGVMEGIKRGSFGFFLNGKKSKGQYSLVKLKKGQENSWLFICNSEENLEQENRELSVLSGKTIEEIAGQKNFSVADYQGAHEIEMPEFIKPMYATLVDKPFDDRNWLFEIKWDGYRTLAFKHRKSLNLYSRNHQKFNEIFFPILESLKNINGDFILDGEVVAVDKDGKSSFQLLQNYLTNRDGTLVYYVFDILYLDGYDLTKVSLIDRKKILELFLPNLNNVKISQHVMELGRTLFNSVLGMEGEGIIGKKNDSTYQPGARSKEWAKIKSQLTQEAVIGGFTAPRGGRKKFGALVLGVWQNGELVYIGHTGGGFDEQSLSVVAQKLLPLVTRESPFKVVPKTNAPVTWVKPEIVCEVKFSQWTNEGVMRQPIFLGLRIDKDSSEVIKEVPEKILQTHAQKPRVYKIAEQEKGSKVIIDGKQLLLTNLSKIYWPVEGYAKQDLIDYYQDIAEYILPHLRDRPQSLNRFPNGIEGKNFFQKDVRDAPSWFESIDIYSESEDRTLRYLLCQDKASLIYLANLGCIEINVWNSRAQSLDKPDYLVFDIDPSGIEFSQAVKVAQETKKILDSIKIKSYCKTSGGRGLHIYIPLGAKYTYEQVKQFALAINLLVNARLPEITSLERKPGERIKKVYLDYLQNREGQTMAAPYSVRPRPGAPVSTPLEWSEVNKKLNPLQFNLKTIKKRLEKKGDLWENMLANSVDLEAALERLEKKIKGSKIKK